MNTNEVALVTGGNKGLGREIVRQLATEGLTVYLGARDAERGLSARDALAKEGLDVRFVQLDVTDPGSVGAAVKSIEADAGRLDALVNNAGIVVEWGTKVADITADQLREVYEVNVFGVVTVTSACIPLLRRSPNGRIVNMSSGLGSLTLLADQDSYLSTQKFLAYSSSKAALNALTVVYSNALRADGTKVNSANPGLVATDLNAASDAPRGGRTTTDGARNPVHLALLSANGPTATFTGGGESPTAPVPW